MMKKLEWSKSNAMTRLSTWWHMHIHLDMYASVYFQELCYTTMLENNHINMIFDSMQWIIRHRQEEVQTSKFMELISYMDRVERYLKETRSKPNCNWSSLNKCTTCTILYTFAKVVKSFSKLITSTAWKTSQYITTDSHGPMEKYDTHP
jgi:hypothetical protein